LLRSASRSDAMTWFKQLLDAQFSSPIPFDFAKAAALRSFVVEDAGAPRMRLVVEDEAPWVEQVISTAQQRAHSEKMARYWFGRFCSSNDLDNRGHRNRGPYKSLHVDALWASAHNRRSLP
jgi:hypothetical protein